MDRNYDELFAEMLMQIDLHTEELRKQSEEMTKVGKELTAHSQVLSQHSQVLSQHSQVLSQHSQELTKQSMASDAFQKELLSKFQDMEKIDNQLQEQLVHSAIILDRIIKKNSLSV